MVKKNKKLIGHNTDATAFQKTLEKNDTTSVSGILIIGAGGVTPSIIWAIRKLNFKSKIFIINRTKEKAVSLLKRLDIGDTGKQIEILNWGEIPDVNLIVNTTSVGLNQNDDLQLDFDKFKNKKDSMFYDLIYNPKETRFLNDAKKRGNSILNGKTMFLFQAKQAFKLWTSVEAEIDEEILKIID